MERRNENCKRSSRRLPGCSLTRSSTSFLCVWELAPLVMFASLLVVVKAVGKPRKRYVAGTMRRVCGHNRRGVTLET
ncbi:uncharacterized protein THITE_2119538 [Thermothielavioides terrestris NRRL 8126]|uniref:Uncharacterized protein n=1 Tax=Thermothielavioides terrestris (strain ATCC 38088 / NRRL 8126) TaxID=578455 RepID=G2RBX8_THETT|nr:uncharacterized protein THITE_2119538 [Thermothielavioides terrestris NRRL 8126]AEO69299.1 hypothetical protein THITE_2119538 [Thermothielavioides terrestris NRRL 8126]